MNVGAYVPEGSSPAVSAAVTPRNGLVRAEPVSAVFGHDSHTRDVYAATVHADPAKTDHNRQESETPRAVQTTLGQDFARPVTKVIDKDTGAVILEYPSEEVQKLGAEIRDSVGLNFDTEG